MLSQIPLVHMFKAARKAGVPLTPFSMLAERRKIDFQVDAQLASAWEAYTGALGNSGSLLKKHMELYYRWKASRLPDKKVRLKRRWLRPWLHREPPELETKSAASSGFICESSYKLHSKFTTRLALRR